MWVTFCYDAETGAQGFRPGNQVEVPDVILRRWQLVNELYIECQIEQGDWKQRSWNPKTKALPQSLHALELAEQERDAEMQQMNGLVSRIAEREREEAAAPSLRAPGASGGKSRPRRSAPMR